MKKLGVAAVLGLILDEMDQSRKPSEELRKQGRAALQSAKKTQKAATAAAAASGKSGRPVSYDGDKLRKLITDGKLSISQIASKIGCSNANVSYVKNKMKAEQIE